MKITLIDWVAWKLIQMVALIQGAIYDYALRHARDNKEFFKFMENSLSGYYIFQMSLNDLPDIARRKLLEQGKLLLFIFIGGFTIGQIMRLLK